jgi:two-component system, NarL family, response regulator NreC
MQHLSILLVEDHKMVREGLRMLINAQADMKVVGEADNGRMAINAVQQLKPDVVVMDVSMPELNGLEATERLKRLCPDIQILILTRHTDDGYLQRMLQAGANGYVLKQSASEELVRAIRYVAAGKSYLDPAVTATVVGSALETRVARGLSQKKALSLREEEVLRLIARGYLSKEVAARLQISIKTAEAHKANAMQKMGMKSRIDIVRYALLEGWLEDS